jgi:hypothetical protein
MKTKTHFAFRIDVWDSSGNSLTEHWPRGLRHGGRRVLGGNPKDKITLRQGARVVLKSRIGELKRPKPPTA